MYSVFANKVLCLFLAAAFIFVSGCKKDDDQPITQANIESTVTSGNWRITWFVEDNVDETSYFSGYSFTFNVSGTVTAAKSGSTVNGNWSAGNDDSKIKLILAFGNDDPWEELNEDWHVLERTNVKIRLQHVSGGDGSIDYLTFERN